MALVTIFLLGVANFVLHKAVIESGHPLLGRLPLGPGGLGRRIMLATEFMVLLVAMLLAANGWPGLAWAYLLYTCANGATAWLILSGRV
jgi:hypothetical protein